MQDVISCTLVPGSKKTPIIMYSNQQVLDMPISTSFKEYYSGTTQSKTSHFNRLLDVDKMWCKKVTIQLVPSGCITIHMTWWRHQMEAFFALLAFCAGNSPVTGEFPHKGQWRGALIFSLICAWTNCSVNNRDAGDLRRHGAHYDVTVMFCHS